ncbi:hypothetical protein OIU74_016636 [Salix koriyanagi]|uniref:Uncharacterized protein n=1 Tax=Salix koriyanagi TaxID=2511006 RepID=A0A9Q0PGT2_9ROSI|nr:hypothetical protein OIU74_016636 [Salix koriyanagi]
MASVSASISPPLDDAGAVEIMAMAESALQGRFHNAGCTEFTATWETQSERGRCFRQWLSCSPKSIIQSTPYVTGITDTEKLADSDWNRE